MQKIPAARIRQQKVPSRALGSNTLPPLPVVEAPEMRIAQRAFELFCEHGQHGHDVDDWLEAEREILSVVAKPAPRRPRKAS